MRSEGCFARWQQPPLHKLPLPAKIAALLAAPPTAATAAISTGRQLHRAVTRLVESCARLPAQRRLSRDDLIPKIRNQLGGHKVMVEVALACHSARVRRPTANEYIIAMAITIIGIIILVMAIISMGRQTAGSTHTPQAS